MFETVDDLIEAVGGTGAVAERLGVGPSAVSNWRSLGVIPSDWYWHFKKPLRRNPPRELFSFKREPAK